MTESCATGEGGNVRKLRRLMTARVPSEPMKSFIISKPATFLTTRPPPFAMLPSARINLIPINQSLAGPPIAAVAPVPEG